MKVKYFIRGLGIGILVTTLLLFAGTRKNQNSSMTDKQVIERAKELGMMTKEEVSDYKLDSSLDNIKDSLSGTEKPESTGTKENSEDGSKETASPSPSPTPSQKPEAASDKKESESKNDRDTVSISIESGMVSQSIAKYLYQKNVIGSASDFNKYMLDHDVTQKIRAGEYEIPTDASYAEIVEIIT